MKSQKPFLYLIFIFFFISGAYASVIHEALYKEKPAFYSYIISDLKTGQTEEEYAADVYATPASCQKVITALAAIQALGVDYQYETKLFIADKQKRTQDIMLSFSGDPMLTSEELLDLLKPLKNTRVKGRIILDASVFKTPPHSPGIMLDDIGKKYAQPVFGINIDKNLIDLEVIATKPGKKAIVKIASSYEVVSSVITTSEPSCIKLDLDNGKVIATGNINPEDKLQKLQFSPYKIEPYIINKVKAILKSLNISGKVEIIHDKKQIPSNFRLIGVKKSKSLRELLPLVLKASDNLISDSLYLTILNSQSHDEVRNWQDGNTIIKEILQKHFGISPDGCTLVDGSGLSRYNAIRPRVLLALLKQGFSIPEFVNNMPKPEEEQSTLKKRALLI